MKTECAYDRVLCESLANKELEESLAEIDLLQKSREKKRLINQKQKSENLVSLIFGVAIAISELQNRADKKFPPTEIWPYLNALAKMYNVTVFNHLQDVFGENTQNTVSVNYEELLNIPQHTKPERVLKKTAKYSKTLHITLGDLLADHEKFKDVKSEGNVPTQKKKSSDRRTQKGDVSSIEKLTQGLKDLRKKLRKVALARVDNIPNSTLGDLEKIAEVNYTLACNFELCAQHIEASASSLSPVALEDIYRRFKTLREQAKIPYAEGAQLLLDLG